MEEPTVRAGKLNCNSDGYRNIDCGSPYGYCSEVFGYEVFNV
jgi:hypothetical protein